MLASLAFAVVTSSSPLVWDARSEPTRYRKGIGYRVELYARNVSDRPVVLAQAIYDGGPAGHVTINLTRGTKTLEPYGESSMPLIQVMQHGNIDANRFITLQPGARAMVYWKRIEGRWEFPSGAGRLKRDYSAAKQVPLEKGSYRASMTYSFDQPTQGPKFAVSPGMKPKYGPGAKALWTSAFRGKGTASVVFSVK